MIRTAKKGEWFELVVPREYELLTIDELFREVWQAPKKWIHHIRMKKEALINGEIANWTSPLKEHDRILIKIFQDIDFGVVPSYYEVEILYEDDHLLIVQKPAGMKTHPNHPEQTDTLANAIAFYLQSKGELRAIQHIHRLDKDTSGVILFAKHALIGAMLDRMLEERKIKRTYSALVHGIIKQRKGTIDAPIGRDRHHPTKRRVSPNGQKAVTHYEVVEKGKGQTLVKCQLATGRTHQIRVHLSHLGFPIVGDPLYGKKEDKGRLALHAERLQFTHPITLEIIDIYSPIIWE